MSDTAAAIEPTLSRKLHSFHLSGRGLEDQRPVGNLQPVLPDGVLAALPAEVSESLAGMHARLLVQEREPARRHFAQDLRQAVSQLQNLLSLDDARHNSPASPAAFGAHADRLISMAQLSDVLASQPNHAAAHSVGMDPSRRSRCEAALATLTKALGEYQSTPAIHVFESSAGSDPFVAALEFCDQQLVDIVTVLRALRIAKWEALSAYDAAVHDPVLERFDWQAADPHEIAALPVVTVIEPSDRLAHETLTSFSRVLRSGRPVQILVPSVGLCIDDLSGSVADCGAIALAHRGAFVLQTSLAQQAHLTHGLQEMVRSLLPAVAVVSLSDSETDSWQSTALLARTIAFPGYRYNPENQGGWHARFQLREPEAEFAGLNVIDALIASGRFRDHFRVLPEGATDEGMLPIAEYWKQYESAPPRAVPYVEAMAGDRRRVKLAVTRELVHLCFDRQRAWEMLQALAAQPAKASSQPTAANAVTEAYQRVLALLANPESLVQ